MPRRSARTGADPDPVAQWDFDVAERVSDGDEDVVGIDVGGHLTASMKRQRQM
jgi:hypothetical protein